MTTSAARQSRCSAAVLLLGLTGWAPGAAAFEQTLYRWRDEFLAGGEAALASGKGGTDSREREIRSLQKEVERRDQVIGELTIANRMPKTALRNST